MVNLGDKVKDVITGFEGTATGAAEYISGCRQVLVAPPVKEDGGFRDGQWFDDDRLAVVAAGAVSLANRKRDGGPQSNPAPTRYGNRDVNVHSVVVHVADPHADAKHRELLAKLAELLAQGERLMALNQEMHGLLDEIDQETNRLSDAAAASAAKSEEIASDIDDLLAGVTDPALVSRLTATRDKAKAQADASVALSVGSAGHHRGQARDAGAATG